MTITKPVYLQVIINTDNLHSYTTDLFHPIMHNHSRSEET